MDTPHRNVRLLIVYYSRFGVLKTLAERIAEGARQSDGVAVELLVLAGLSTAIGAADRGGAVGRGAVFEDRRALTRRDQDHPQVHHHRQDRVQRLYVAAVRCARGGKRRANLAVEEVSAPGA